MPELPEVETVRRQLERHLVDRRFVAVEILDPRLTRPEDPVGCAERLTDLTVRSVQRRGKYLIIDLIELVAIVHLRMTGAFVWPSDDDRHIRAQFTLSPPADGQHPGPLLFRDTRRFGTLTVLTPLEAQQYIDSRLGAEPLDTSFGPRELRRALARSTSAVKAALLNQHLIAGVGNIYADEALHTARIDPRRPADELSAADARRLHASLVAALDDGIQRGGATVRNYASTEGAGRMQELLRVYGRAGMPCITCGTALSSTRIAGRTTVWCAKCQRK